MAQHPRLEQRQTQRLAMTRELRESLELLQLDCLDLAAFVAREIEGNPLLEPDSDKYRELDGKEVERGEIDSLAATREAFDSDLTTTVFNNDSPSDLALPREPRLRDRAAGGASLGEFIHDQIGLLPLSHEETLIANFLADSLDEAGYLAVSPEEAAKKLGAAPARVKTVLKILQTLEPPGVFARDLEECLALQLEDRGYYDSCAKRLLGRLDLVAAEDYPAMRKLCRVGDTRLKALIGHIRALDPKPGLHYASGETVQTVIPDIFITPSKGKGYRVELNTETLPRILVNETYVRELEGRDLTPAENGFLKQCEARAGWLKRALNQRAETMLKVAEALVRAQRDFLARGVRHLKPLTLKKLAGELGLHESTVSRVVSNKYVSTPRGVFRLKSFFSTALPEAGAGGAASAEGVRQRIRELIADERPGEALSDAKIAEALKREGTKVSRRTVVKYREAMGISSSYARKKANGRGRRGL